MEILEKDELVKALEEYIYEDRVQDRYRLKELIKQAITWFGEIDTEIGAALRAGAEEGFWLGKRVFLPQNYGGMTDQEKKEAFGTCDLGPLSDLSHATAREEYENWKEGTEPKIGDQIVTVTSGEMGVITKVESEAYEILTEHLESVWVSRSDFKLTGRSIDLEKGQFWEIGANGDDWRAAMDAIREKYTIGIRWWAAVTQATSVSVNEQEM